MLGQRLYWSGGGAPMLDAPTVVTMGPAVLGRFGGSIAHGATKNEDGALLWVGDGWVFTVVLDGHATCASVDAVLTHFSRQEPRLRQYCEKGDFQGLQGALIAELTDNAFRAEMSSVRGETACLIVYQNGAHVLWLSIGDNTLYLLHPELFRLGQSALTVRNFFEWIGERSSLAGDPPCFSTGIRELRQGRSVLVALTDGIQEMPGAPTDCGQWLMNAFVLGVDPSAAMSGILATAVTQGARDSCTLVAWAVDNPHRSLMPSG